MGDCTPNLSAWEFACKCSDPDCTHKQAAHMPLLVALQDVADHFKEEFDAARVSIDIRGGNRCRPHNIVVQMQWSGKTRTEAEASKSTHMDCIAADFKIKVKLGDSWHQVPPVDVQEYLVAKYPTSHGIGLYHNRNHLDTRATTARW